jgi:hypothetical protein
MVKELVARWFKGQALRDEITRRSVSEDSADTRLHREWLLERSRWDSPHYLEMILDSLERKGLLFTNKEFLRRQAAGEPLDPLHLVTSHS